MAPVFSYHQPPSVRRVRVGCGSRFFTAKLGVVIHNLAHQLLGAGIVASLSRPGGNTTGFSSFDYSLSGQWLELLKEIVPNLTRIAETSAAARRIPHSRMAIATGS